MRLTMQRAAGGVGPAIHGCAIFGQPVAATCPALVRPLGALSCLPPVTVVLHPVALVPGPCLVLCTSALGQSSLAVCGGACGGWLGA